MTQRRKTPLPLATLLVAWTIATAIGSPIPGNVAAPSPIEEAYRDILGTLARGDTAGALATLLEVELLGVPSGSDDEIEKLEARQLAVARRLADSSSESLVPMALLHERAYLAYLEQRSSRLAIHSRLLTVELIELYIDVSERPDSDRLASDLLTSLGGFLQQATMASVAIRLYERALDLERRNTAALLGLAGLFERQGDYPEALSYLDTLLRYDSRHREARLKLGINLLRLGRREEGETALEQLRLGREEDWILSLAYQELARLSSADEDPQRARRLLIEARDRLPDDPSLAVQIAYLTDRTGGRHPSGELAKALQSTAGSSKPSPRSLYSRVAGQALEELRAGTEANGRRRLAQLAEALRRSGRNRQAAP